MEIKIWGIKIWGIKIWGIKIWGMKVMGMKIWGIKGIVSPLPANWYKPVPVKPVVLGLNYMKPAKRHFLGCKINFL